VWSLYQSPLNSDIETVGAADVRRSARVRRTPLSSAVDRVAPGPSSSSLLLSSLELIVTKVYADYTIPLRSRSASERGGHTLKRFKDFYLKATAKMWSGLSYVRHNQLELRTLGAPSECTERCSPPPSKWAHQVMRLPCMLTNRDGWLNIRGQGQTRFRVAGSG